MRKTHHHVYVGQHVGASMTAKVQDGRLVHKSATRTQVVIPHQSPLDRAMMIELPNCEDSAVFFRRFPVPNSAYRGRLICGEGRKLTLSAQLLITWCAELYPLSTASLQFGRNNSRNLSTAP